MRRISLIVCLLAFAQGISAQKITFKDIQSNENYIYGVGRAATIDAASRMALDELINSISVSVQSQFEHSSANTILNNDVTTTTDTKQIVKTYSRMTLNGSKQLITSSAKDKEKTVVRYITMDDLKKMFDERGKKADGYIASARRSADKGMIGTALQYYFWSMALLYSYPDGNKLQIRDKEQNLQYAYSWIPVQMKELLGKITATTQTIEKDEDEKIITVRVDYDGKPTDDISFTCSDGAVESDIVVAKNGEGTIYLPADAKEKKLIINIDYRGREEANRDLELVDIIDCAESLSFKEASINLGRDIKKKQQTTFADTERAKFDVVRMDNPTATAKTAEYKEDAKVEKIVRYLDAQEAAPYIPVAQKIEQILRSRKFDQLQALCTDEGWDMVQKLIKYGDARMAGYPNIQFLDNNGDITVRSYPMSFQFKSNNKRKFSEDVVFHLNREGKITQIAFALDKRSANDIFCNRGDWGDLAKQTIVNFMETYKTAFALRDIDYIDHIFSDDALILVGRVVKPTTRKSDLPVANFKHVDYIRKTKKEYMRDLEKAFNSNEYINIKFGETEVEKGGFKDRTTGKPMEVYGIQLKQDYYSQHYGDTGYLFLAVDLSDAANPLIHIRTWQPEKDVTNGERFGWHSF